MAVTKVYLFLLLTKFFSNKSLNRCLFLSLRKVRNEKIAMDLSV